MNLAKTMHMADYATARVKADEDDAADAFEDAKEAAARQVTFDDVLEELTELDDRQKAYVMAMMDTDRRHFEYKVLSLFEDAIEKIARRRAFKEITKARGR